MRNTFITHLKHLASSDPNIWLLTGDLGYSVLDAFAKEFPERYINMGIAEQNMIGVATGIALEGQKTFVYSIANFPTFRCLEQIRNDVCYHNANVKIVSVGAGLAYGTHGYTHYGIEDLAVMRTLPNMTILSPADPREAKRCAEIAVSINGPVYVRLGKNGEPHIHNADLDFSVGDILPVFTSNSETIILSTGSICYEAVSAAQKLKSLGHNVSVYSVPTIKPFNINSLKNILTGVTRIITLEEHVSSGGLYGIVCETLQTLGLSIRVNSLAVPENIKIIGTQKYLLKELGLDAEGICKYLRNA